MTSAFDVPAGVLVPVAGRPILEYVLSALERAAHIAGGVVCGPAKDIVHHSETLQALFSASSFQWLAPSTGPAASALNATLSLDQFPVLITAGDHALLTPAVVDSFCADANRQQADVVVGLVPYDLVQQTYPESRRTVLRFADASFCGSNLFALLTPQGRAALEYWRALEADRKKPWRLARKLGIRTAIAYVLRRLTLSKAFEVLSAKSNCRISPVLIAHAFVAVDVDSEADQALAERVMTSRVTSGNGADS